jgi:FkbM family methyltransferase
MKAAKILKDTGIVIACEPFIGVYQSLIKGVDYNKYSNVRLRNLCIGLRKELMRFYLNFNKPNSYSLNKFDSNASFIEVLVISLDDLVDWENLETVSYIKIDAEGAEESIIKGGVKTIQKFRPIIQMETIFDGLEDILRDYACFVAPDSPNHVFIPKDHEKVTLPERFGWKAATV